MDSGILILIAAGGICLIFLVGFILRVINQRNKNENKDEKEKLEVSSESDLEIEPKQKQKPKKVPSRNLTEVANLWRDNRNGRLIFQIEGQMYKRGDELTNREREILLKIVMDFYRWLEPPSPIISKVDRSDQSEHPVASPPNPSGQPGIPEDSQLNEQTESKGLTPTSLISRALRSDLTVPLPSQSMVTQVDEILQEKLQAANMQSWAVRLVELPEKGMVVLVGLEQYSFIDDLPYERVRVIIRESVSEWERRAENGKLAQ